MYFINPGDLTMLFMFFFFFFLFGVQPLFLKKITSFLLTNSRELQLNYFFAGIFYEPHIQIMIIWLGTNRKKNICLFINTWRKGQKITLTSTCPSISQFSSFIFIIERVLNFKDIYPKKTCFIILFQFQQKGEFVFFIFCYKQI